MSNVFAPDIRLISLQMLFFEYVSGWGMEMPFPFFKVLRYLVLSPKSKIPEMRARVRIAKNTGGYYYHCFNVYAIGKTFCNNSCCSYYLSALSMRHASPGHSLSGSFTSSTSFKFLPVSFSCLLERASISLIKYRLKNLIFCNLPSLFPALTLPNQYPLFVPLNH